MNSKLMIKLKKVLARPQYEIKRSSEDELTLMYDGLSTTAEIKSWRNAGLEIDLRTLGHHNGGAKPKEKGEKMVAVTFYTKQKNINILGKEKIRLSAAESTEMLAEFNKPKI